MEQRCIFGLRRFGIIVFVYCTIFLFIHQLKYLPIFTHSS